MLGKLYNAMAAIALAACLAVAGLAGYLYATGKLDVNRLETVVAVLRGEVNTAGEEVAEAEPAETESTSTGGAAEQPTRPSADEARARRQREELASLRLERAQADLAVQRRMLDQVMQHIVQEQEKLAGNEEAFRKEREERDAALMDTGFDKELKLLSGLKPTQAKEHLVRTWKERRADAVRLMMKLDERQAKRILEQMRSSEEQVIMSELLEQIRLQGTEGYADSSGRTDGAATP